MPGGFTPASRAVVKEKTKQISHVHDVTRCGPGLMVVYKSGYSGTISFAYLVEKYGWSVQMYLPDDRGDFAVLMPITEVPADA